MLGTRDKRLFTSDNKCSYMNKNEFQGLLNKERLIDFFIECVKIDSISREERVLLDRISEEILPLDLEIKEDGCADIIEGNAGNLIINIPGDNSQSSIFLSAHMDRVEPGRGIVPIINGEYIESKGDTILAGDDIIGVASIVEALKILKENNIQHRPFKIIFTVAEEIGLLGAKNLNPAELQNIDFGFVFDTDGDIGTAVFQAPTQIKFNALITGKAAHAGMNPEKGINAIKIASLAISNMKLGQISEKTTANIGVIRGGRASNIIPDLVELEGEIRSHSDEELLDQQTEMISIIDYASKKFSGKVSYDIEKLYSSFAIPLESDIIRVIKEVNSNIGIKTDLRKSGGGSDANVFNEFGIPTLNLGVGMENVHSSEERVKVDNLLILTELILEILTVKDK